MDKNELLKMAENPEFIPGIYNYCDRWCERCDFTRRCMVYAMGEKDFPDQKGSDVTNGKFWDTLKQSFSVTVELLKDMAKEKGVDLDAVAEEEENRRRTARREKVKDAPVGRAARQYSMMVREWFGRNEQIFKEKQETLTREFELGIGEPELTAVNLLKAIDVIRWYQHQIWVKLMRALNGEETDRDEAFEEFPRDSDGSAKVALIGIDRSSAAWGEVRGHLADEADSIMDIIKLLTRLRENVEEHFPRARSFVRPGFDQET